MKNKEALALCGMAAGAFITVGLLFAMQFTGPAEYLMGAAIGALVADRAFSFSWFQKEKLY
ncbi:hypothetical protein PUV47_04155 [Pseudovibrio exalbescens]|uniref:hypothetical protein n=1 Tax=Pseudovibrio exalbescens TaxID=197461 RepID=UPI00236647DF|nr:hypothetical protein [Pseudovibrio exalbescens]MDD7909098.1 hypothetical protein [Pseudovibrio exalbescens]